MGTGKPLGDPFFLFIFFFHFYSLIPSYFFLHTHTHQSVYDGEFSEGNFHGKGTYTWPDGSCFSGIWANNVPNQSGNHVDNSVRLLLLFLLLLLPFFFWIWRTTGKPPQPPSADSLRLASLYSPTFFADADVLFWWRHTLKGVTWVRPRSKVEAEEAEAEAATVKTGALGEVLTGANDDAANKFAGDQATILYPVIAWCTEELICKTLTPTNQPSTRKHTPK